MRAPASIALRSLSAALAIVAAATAPAFDRAALAGDAKDGGKAGHDDAGATAPDGKDGGTEAKKDAGPVECVTFAKTWADAVKDAKARGVPIVLHNHGFYCPPCWGMHETVLRDPAYIEFEYENAIEVLALDRLKEGVGKNEERAATYDGKQGGKPVKFLVEFPGLTVDEAVDMLQSKASSYNKSGGLPYTAIIDPYTEDEVKSWKGGGIKPTEIMDAVTEAKKAFAKAHKFKPRPEVKTLSDAEAASTAKTTAGDYAAALDGIAAATKKADKDGWPPHLRARAQKAKDAAIAAATEALERIEAAKDEDAAKARKDLVALSSRLRGTGLEARAKDLLATLPAPTK